MISQHRASNNKEKTLQKPSESREESGKHIDPRLHKNGYKYRIRNRKRQLYV